MSSGDAQWLKSNDVQEAVDVYKPPLQEGVIFSKGRMRLISAQECQGANNEWIRLFVLKDTKTGKEYLSVSGSGLIAL